MTFERLIPKLKKFMEIEYSYESTIILFDLIILIILINKLLIYEDRDVAYWREGRSPSKRRKISTSENQEKYAQIVFFCATLAAKNRSGVKCNKNMAVRILKKLSQVFEE